MIRKTVHYAGRVQGVGFRYTTQRVARGHEVTGYVRNLRDGRVELVAEGERAAVDAFLAGVADAMSGHIDDVHVDETAASGEFRDFGLRH